MLDKSRIISLKYIHLSFSLIIFRNCPLKQFLSPPHSPTFSLLFALSTFNSNSLLPKKFSSQTSQCPVNVQPLMIFKYFTVMKVNKNKNSTFISNHQLIEGLRNRSARSLNRNRSSETSISLIERKKFDQNLEPNIQMANSNQHSPIKTILR